MSDRWLVLLGTSVASAWFLPVLQRVELLCRACWNCTARSDINPLNFTTLSAEVDVEEQP